jgi:putative DNA methylase
MDKYCKRLIEVDLPIKRISEHARNEKNLRKGHPSHLHIWWARRPWGACRVVALAALLPAPTDKNCPSDFVEKAYKILSSISKPKEKTRECVQDALLQFVADFSSWELGAHSVYKDIAEKLIQLNYPSNSPLVLDSFAGYGAIPGEAARLGCESIAGELNPVAILCLKSMLEEVPKYGYGIIETMRDGIEFIKKETTIKLSKYYPTHNGKMPIAWLWARTAWCEGPNCGIEIPLISQTVLATGKRKAWIEIDFDSSTSQIHIFIKHGNSIPKELIKTAGGGHAVCPACGFTTNKVNIKKQGKLKKMGNRLFGKVIAIGQRQGKEYAEPSKDDFLACNKSRDDWNKILSNGHVREISEKYPYHERRAFSPGLYGIEKWGDIFSPRQTLALHHMGNIIKDYREVLKNQGHKPDFVRSVCTILSLPISNYSTYCNNLAYWGQDHLNYCYQGMGMAMRWDWAEASPLVPVYVGGIDYAFNQAINGLESCIDINSGSSTVIKSDARTLPLPDDSVELFFTDPPYYDLVPYADLSDLCYVWLRRFIGDLHPELFVEDLTPKNQQILVNPYSKDDGRGDQSDEYYQEGLTSSFCESKRVLKSNGIGAIVFAHKGTTAWETFLTSIIKSGFVITASWPIDTEKSSRMRANKSAALGSSVHIIIRPRDESHYLRLENEIGNWRDVLNELPVRIHEWMPRLAEENVVGADAIFACLGPALEIFSRYSSVEKASGEKVELKEYLEEIWAAVSREALNMIFEEADASGFEEDARLTAMWLWTLRTATNGDEDEPDEGEKIKNLPGYSLEFDAARKIAQGLGVHLEKLSHLVEIKSGTAMLLSAGARSRYLFGKESTEVPSGGKKKKKASQQTLFDFEEDIKQIESESSDWVGDVIGAKVGSTILDHLHQSMILFAAGRGEAMKRLIVEEGVGQNPQFWKLAQALSALYPAGTDEKRWVDGVLARKKGLGF